MMRCIDDLSWKLRFVMRDDRHATGRVSCAWYHFPAALVVLLCASFTNCS